MRCASCGQPVYVLFEVSLTVFQPLPPFVREWVCKDCIEMAMRASRLPWALPPDMPMTINGPFTVNVVHYEALREAVPFHS